MPPASGPPRAAPPARSEALGRRGSPGAVRRGAAPLRRSFVVVAIALAVGLMAATTAAAAPAPPSIDYQARVVETFVDANGNVVPYRQGWHAGGSTGFGYDKVAGKHKITNSNVLAATIRSPQEARREGDGRWVYEKTAILYGFFTVSDQTTVRVVVSYGSWQGPDAQGVVTAYCVGYVGPCPEWVDRAFSID